MQRCTSEPRVAWREAVERHGLSYHTHEASPYWDESVCYTLTPQDVARLETAAQTLHQLCLEAAEVVLQRGWLDRLGISPRAWPVIERSWERDDFSLYGRFDLAYDGVGEPKLLEYNADTPTALVEAAVTQWFWLQDTRPHADQFNSIHERLLAAWQRRGALGECVHFAGIRESSGSNLQCTGSEDEQTLLYLRDTCTQANLRTKALPMLELGWDTRGRCFVDQAGAKITDCFKLYPWEWLWEEPFAEYLAADPVRWLEPPWKLLLQSKGLLPILWELFPGHANLLAAYEQPDPLGGDYVQKPRFSREGANVSWIEGGCVREAREGVYGEAGFIYQQLARPPDFGGFHPVFGAWVVDHAAAGVGIREDTHLITTNLSRFVPHYIEP